MILLLLGCIRIEASVLIIVGVVITNIKCYSTVEFLTVLAQVLNRALKLLIPEHHIVERVLRLREPIELLDEISIDCALQLFGLLNKFNEPVSVWGQIIDRFQVAHGDTFRTMKHIGDFLTPLDHFVSHTFVKF